MTWTLGTGSIGVIDGYYDIFDIKGPPGYVPSGVEHLI
ncbi:hypothetical protein Q670_15380 [Alcanivorax sp. P2S70]|nr:hypothetical protein Q670_15380 [Alcanivorax sp. P2S70]